MYENGQTLYILILRKYNFQRWSALKTDSSVISILKMYASRVNMMYQFIPDAEHE